MFSSLRWLYSNGNTISATESYRLDFLKITQVEVYCSAHVKNCSIAKLCQTRAQYVTYVLQEKNLHSFYSESLRIAVRVNCCTSNFRTKAPLSIQFKWMIGVSSPLLTSWGHNTAKKLCDYSWFGCLAEIVSRMPAGIPSSDCWTCFPGCCSPLKFIHS